ncbi:hypothetical protein N9V61_04115 [Flavobacteriaceae bacterium]|nr:hypothetical protein [Flavobacteriaceae bacterium]
MGKIFKSEVMSDDISNVVLYAEFIIEKRLNISESWIVSVFYKGLEEELEVHKVTRDWIDNPYKVLSEVKENDIEFLALQQNEWGKAGDLIGERICHRERIRWKKDVFAHRYLLNELCTNADIDITNQEVNYIKNRWVQNSIDTTITHEI